MPDGSAPTVVPPNTVPPRIDYVFLMNVQNDEFYKNAEGFFKTTFPAAVLVKDKKTLAEVLDTVNAGGKAVRNLFVVSHANQEGNLGFSLNAADLAKDAGTGDHKLRTEFKELKAIDAQPGSLPVADVKLIDAQTKVEIKGCNIGRSQRMLDALGQAFGGQAEVVAPTHRQGYRSQTKGGTTTYTEELGTYFVEQTGIVPDKKRAVVMASFAAKYPDVPPATWKGFVKKVQYDPSKRLVDMRQDLNPPLDEQAAAVSFFNIAKEFPPADGWTLTYNGRTAANSVFAYSIHAERVLKDGSTEFQDLTRTVPIPVPDADLEAAAAANSGRPDSTFELERKITGENLVRTVFEERTQWRIDGTIVGASGPAHPPESDPTFFGHHAAAPPPPPSTSPHP